MASLFGGPIAGGLAGAVSGPSMGESPNILWLSNHRYELTIDFLG